LGTSQWSRVDRATACRNSGSPVRFEAKGGTSTSVCITTSGIGDYYAIDRAATSSERTTPLLRLTQNVCGIGRNGRRQFA
jgi:hypothetical protein